MEAIQAQIVEELQKIKRIGNKNKATVPVNQYATYTVPNAEKQPT